MPSPAAWFQQLFGFPESDYDTTRDKFTLEGTSLLSLPNNRRFPIGTFTTPTLASLRHHTADAPRGELRLTHEIIGDVLRLHALPENRNAVFQVASQFNCLEFAGPEVVPEDGVTGYAFDPTQGPACSLAAAAATVYRNYFAPVGGAIGQRRDRQIDNLAGLDAALGHPGAYWDVVNGYTRSDSTRLERLDRALATHDRDALLGAVAVGLHADVGVTFADRFTEPALPTSVTQVFCSALSCGYSDVALECWEGLATLVLDAAYEATLRAALLDHHDDRGASDGEPRRVWLTLLGGGAFGNRSEWIAQAIGRALARLEGTALDVRIGYYRAIDPSIARIVDRARRV